MTKGGASLCRTFLELGDAVSRNLAFAYGTSLSFGEETITEGNLLQLRYRHRPYVEIHPFTKRAEALNGADWEWRLIGRRYTLRMRVQAKRLAKNGKQLKGLFSQKAKSAPYPQIDMLIGDAKMHGLLPIYCIYSVESAKRKWVSASMPQGFEAGCLLALADDVKVAGSQQLSAIEDFSFPWHFLVCGESRLSPFPVISFLNSGRADSLFERFAHLPYIVRTELIDVPPDVDVPSIRDDLKLPDDYEPAPVRGRFTIDCRHIEY